MIKQIKVSELKIGDVVINIGKVIEIEKWKHVNVGEMFSICYGEQDQRFEYSGEDTIYVKVGEK